MRALIACLLTVPLLIGGCDRQSPPEGQAANNAAAPAPDEATSPDEVTGNAALPVAGAIDRSHKGEKAPAAAFLDPAGKSVSLADFRGAPVLVNLWATWCGPCVKEMPTLDALAKSGAVRVVAVSQDLGGAAKVTPFFKAHGFTALKPYLDPKLGLGTALGANLPTTILYDAQGREVWRETGGYDWSGDSAKKLIADAA
ncbi:MAG: TlpA family protein disulfide reductase [Sphingomonas sp.]